MEMDSSPPLVLDLVRSFSLDDINYLQDHLKVSDDISNIENKIDDKIEGVDEEGFIQLIDEIYTRDNSELPVKMQEKEKQVILNAAKELFLLIAIEIGDDRNKSKRVTWTKLLDYLLIALDPFIIKEVPTEEELKILRKKNERKLNKGNYILQITDAGHCKAPKREPISAITKIESESEGTFCYVLISRHGRVGVYSAGLDLLSNYQLSPGGSEFEMYRYKTRYWITDCTYVPKTKSLLISDTNRSLFVIDASVVHHELKLRITGFPSAISCLHWYQKSESDSSNETNLLIGDESGMVTEITFHRAGSKELFQPGKPGEKAEYFWPNVLKQQKAWVTASTPEPVHPHGTIDKITFYSSINAVVTCCRRLGELSVRPRGSALPPHTVKDPKGICCFDVCNDGLSRIGLLTGGPDGVIRLWTSRTPRYAQVEIKAHLTPIIQVCWHTPEGIISVSKDGEIRIWNRFFISEIEWKCVQTLNVRCEALNAPGQPVAWPTKALFPGPITTDEMLLVCDCHLIRIRNENDSNNQEEEIPAKATPRPPPIEREPTMDSRSISYERAHEHKINISGELNRILVEHGVPHLSLSLDDINLEEVNLPELPCLSRNINPDLF